MATETERIADAGSSFRLGDWLVEPSLNRISRGGAAVQLERKAMDILVYLAGRPGELVDRRELLDAVWQTEFVSYNTIVGRIYELREALEDDARDPRYIETIPKRGYRLIAELSFGPAAQPEPGVLAEMSPEGDDERPPYPGLASFSELDADDFFGREAEIAALWRKIASRRLLAVIGASGAGKSSLLRAGIVARAPPGWRAVVCQPGEEPFLAVARALAPDLMDDPEEMKRLLAFHNSDMALAVAARWRGRWDEALLVVDQFEELFTLNQEPVSERFADLLRRLVDAAGIHVVLVLRDDFLIECHRHPPLEPIFSDLTPIGPPAGAELRRALTEPAARRLYGFESESMVDEMVGEVEAERGALPLLAFAVSRLWELRDRERRLLTREAYERIGGVAGALAQHAEATLEKIGRERLPIVRELFRNLVTAQGTRAVREWHELLSIFDSEAHPMSSRASAGPKGRSESRDPHRVETALPTIGSLQASGDPSTPRPSEGRSAQDDRKKAAAEVLRTLIDARLLTSFKDDATEGSAEGTGHRVEIVHESLLQAWPRLVRWQTQDADAAQLRDQLRQAARTWDEHERTDDMLWTGSAFREFAVWRERYPGGLTELEEAFAAAMTSLATRRRRRRRIAAVAGVSALLVVLAIVTGLWRRSVQETRRAEAAKLLALAQVQLGTGPTEALALITASLEVADTDEARELVMRALWAAPPAFELDMGVEQLPSPSFSPDGRHVAVAGLASAVRVWSADGHGPAMLGGHTTKPSNTARWAARNLVVTGKQTDIIGPAFGAGVRLWSIPEGRPLRAVDFGSPGYWQVGPGQLFAQIELREGGERRVELKSWSLPDGPEMLLRSLSAAELEGISDLVAAPDGSGWVVARGDAVSLRSFAGSDPERLLEEFEADASVAPFGETGVLASDAAGNSRLWSFDRDGPHRAWAIRRPTGATGAVPDPTGRRIASLAPSKQYLQMWELDGLPGSRPLELRRSGSWYVPDFTFHPAGDWCVATLRAHRRLTFWPLTRPYPSVVEAFPFPGARKALAFSPDSRWLATGWEGGVRLLPVGGGDWSQAREIRLPKPRAVADLRFDPQGGYLFVVSSNDAWVVSLDGGPSRQVVPLQDRQTESGAVSPSGARVATATFLGEGPCSLHVVDVATGERTSFDLPSPENKGGLPGGVISLDFLDEQTLLTMGSGGLRRWDLATGTHELVVEGGGVVQQTADAGELDWRQRDHLGLRLGPGRGPHGDRPRHRLAASAAGVRRRRRVR
jgi:DNA-binding winged helix-turn-helix (wHTH) protein/WD40 repeat protein